MKTLKIGLFSSLIAVLMAAPAFAQVGSALSNNPMIHQGPMGQQAGIGDIQQRAQSETPVAIVKDASKAMDDADPLVRVKGLKSLANIQNPDVNGILLRGLVDPDIRVKIKAIDILGNREVSDAVQQMSQMLFLRSTEDAVKLHLVSALGKIADARGTLPVMQYLEEQGDERSRGTAVFALGEIGDAQATDTLTNVATEDHSEKVRRLAQEALEKIDGELPAQHSSRLAASQDDAPVPTDQRLFKLRQIDEEIQKQKGY